MTEEKKPIWIAAITRGHNGGVCLLKDGEIVFSIEEERLSRQKYDGGPFASMMKILDYTDKLDYLVIAHTTPKETAGKIDFSGEDMYTGFARKIGLIDRTEKDRFNHPQVIDLSHIHHKLHAACAFYRSGFDKAVAVIVDGAGTFIDLQFGNEVITAWETESIFECSYPDNFKTLYKHLGLREAKPNAVIENFSSDRYGEEKETHECVITDGAGIVKVYEAVTEYCGFNAIEAGKTMGLFPYGNKDNRIPPLFDMSGIYPKANRNLIVPRYPNGAVVNEGFYDFLRSRISEDLSTLENRRNLAYECQTQSQEQVLRLIAKAIDMSGCKNVVLSGGYGLNCVANYFYLQFFKEDNINFYAEPISNDAGTAIGAAMLVYRMITKDENIHTFTDNLYLGPKYDYSMDEIEEICSKYNAEYKDTSYEEVVTLLREKNIVAMFQGRSENGPRALGNRSLLFDPTFKDGKDFVNRVKRREYFRPFAGTILKEHAHEWFDLRGKDESPSMMYAVNCQPFALERIPSIIHVDGTCRIQTVTKEQNEHFYNLISEFFKVSEVPILFNTSFNLGGDPLVETLDDAVATLAKSEVEYLFLPEYSLLIRVLN